MQLTTLKALALRILSGNSGGNPVATVSCHDPQKPTPKVATEVARTYRVFEYRPEGSERWLVLFSIRPEASAELLERDLAERFGCSVETRCKG